MPLPKLLPTSALQRPFPLRRWLEPPTKPTANTFFGNLGGDSPFAEIANFAIESERNVRYITKNHVVATATTTSTASYGTNAAAIIFIATTATKSITDTDDIDDSDDNTDIKPLLNLPQLQHLPNLRHCAPSNPPSQPCLANAVFATKESPVGSFRII